MKKKVLISLILIFIIAIFFGLWQIDRIPPGLYPDEAINGNEATSNPGKIFYPDFCMDRLSVMSGSIFT